MRNLEATGKTEFMADCQWRCKDEDSGLSCGECQSCVLSSKLLQTSYWFLKAGELTKRKFLSGVLARCENSGIGLLENVRNVLEVTMGKDFTYARSRLKPGLSGDASHCSSNRALDPKILKDAIRQTWDWFSHSSNWTKSNYLMGILALCDTELLHILGNLVHVLLVREKRNPLRSALGGTEDEIASIPESHYSFSSDGNPDLELLICASSVYGAVDLPSQCQADDVMETTVDTGCGSLTTVSDGAHKESSYARYGSATSGCDERDASDTDSAYSDDPALTVVPKSSRSFSGVGRHRDFIRQLPVHITKRILGLLDSASLRSCLNVSQHWQYLALEVQHEGRVKRLLEKKAMSLQGKAKAVNPAFARFQDVLVAVRDDEKFMYHGDLSSRSRKDRAFEATYTGVITKTVTMEERNVFCGAYNMILLHSREDPSRVTHYGGGQLVVTGSKDRVVRLVDVLAHKEVPPTMHGHAGSIRAVLLCEDRGLVFSAGYDLSIRCWNLKTGTCTTLFRGHKGTINCLDLHGDKLVSGSKDGRVKVWNLSGKCDDSLRFKHNQPVLCVKMDKSCVLSSCAGGFVKLWSLETSSLLKVMEAHKGPVGCLYLNEWHILSGGSDGEAMAWSANPDFKKCLMTYSHPMEVLSLTCQYLRAITGCLDGKIRIFNFVTGDCLKVIKACGHNSPVHSIHVAENNMVVDTDTGIFLLQFAKVRWDYTSSSECEAQEDFGGFAEEGESGLRKHGDSYVRAERMAVIGSSSHKLFPLADQGSEAFSHHARSLSALSMTHAREAQQEWMRSVAWSPRQPYRHNRAYIDLQPEFMHKGSSALSSSSGHAPTAHSASHAPSTATSDLGRERSLTISELSRSEKALLRRVQTRGSHRPVTPERMLLTLGSSSQLCPLAEPLRANMESNARVRDAWGSKPPPPPPPLPPPSPPRDDLCRRPDTAPPLSTASPSRHGGLRLGYKAPSSPPPPLVEGRVQPDTPKLPQPSLYTHSNVVYTPLMRLASEPSPNTSPVPRSGWGTGCCQERSKQARSCATSPVRARSEFRGHSCTPHQRKRPQTAGTAGAAARKVMTPSTPLDQGDPSSPPRPPHRHPPPPHHTPLRSPPTAPPSSSSRSAKRPSVRHVEFEAPPASPVIVAAPHNPLDPFREHADFRLRTDTQLAAYVRQETQRAWREYARARAEAQRLHPAGHDPRRRKMTVWRVRVKGLPHEDFTKEDQVYAPELGPDVYI
ncbi:F-box and WD repeat domain containing protein 10B [Sardina pilchardus]|uniref:F-box and WD repeat domain containing protein 10B n=1 Tax=Sardina pilchardus TaxID=27697 RepID=UPI002E133060